MGFKIDCPTCGLRSYHEFWHGGELRAWKDDRGAEEDYETVWLRENVAGPQLERWFHYAGCHRWLTIRHDTRTNEVTVVETPNIA
jgi:heterotetrameric sarcosine oxidase delta subunit